MTLISNRIITSFVCSSTNGEELIRNVHLQERRNPEQFQSACIQLLLHYGFA